MRILMIGSALTVNGGIQRYILNLLTHMDLAAYSVDLLATQAPAGVPSGESQLRAAGVRRIFWMPGDDKQRLFFYRGFLQSHPGYDIIHFHTTSKVNALACGVIKHACPGAKLIVHSHIVYPPLTLSWRAAHVLYQHWADFFLGCSVAAGRFVFGPHIDQKPNFSVACNAVDAARFCPDAAARARVRAQYGVPQTALLAGFVGRYNHQKNLGFLLDIFREMAARDARWQLLLVGGGEDQPMVDAKIAALGLQSRVRQAGVQSDIPDYMNAFDLFLLPSEFEGSPVTLVEAQGCGVPCLASTNVPADGAVTELVRFLPLTAPTAEWAQAAQQAATGAPHQSHWAQMRAAGYELDTAARAMEALYTRLAGK
jgi:glycosyltransferase involved in cell wall biosynthesis